MRSKRLALTLQPGIIGAPLTRRFSLSRRAVPRHFPYKDRRVNLSFLIFLSVLQGVTELFPVSSLGHTLLVPALFGMHIDKHAPQLLPFLVALHLGTAFALL
jgi:undecaprenyl-diphosphatase